MLLSLPLCIELQSVNHGLLGSLARHARPDRVNHFMIFFATIGFSEARLNAAHVRLRYRNDSRLV